MLRTPHVDSLAREGVGSPLCVPARLSLVTGLYPHNSNLWQNDATCPLDADTFMNRLRASGYRTCSIGKNHLYPMEKDLYAHEDSYRQIGFDHIEDMSGTWGDHAKQSGYTDHLEQPGLLDGLQSYLRALDAQPDQERRFVAEALPIPAEHYIDAFVGQCVERYIDSERYPGWNSGGEYA